MNYYRRYSGDYLRKTAKLSMLEHGAYSLLLDYYYADESPLPGDREEIYRMVRAMTPADRKAIDKVLGLYFELRNGVHHNERADEEIAKAQPAIEAARLNGGKGGRPPKRRNKNPPDYPEENPPGYYMDEPTGLEAGIQPPSSNHQPPALSPQPLPANPQPESKSAALPLPVWLPPEWAEYCQHRREKRSTLTPTATKRCIAKLERWKADGKDIAAILRHNIENGYTGLFEPPVNGKGQPGGHAAAFAEAERRLFNDKPERDITDESERL